MGHETFQQHLRRRLAEILRLPPEERIPALKEFLQELRKLELERMQEADATEIRAMEEEVRAMKEFRRVDEQTRPVEVKTPEPTLEAIARREEPPLKITPRQLEYWTTAKLHGAAERLYEAHKLPGGLSEEQRRQVDYIARIQQYKHEAVERGEYRPDAPGQQHLAAAEHILHGIRKTEKKYHTD
jgi:hypothetical protein